MPQFPSPGASLPTPGVAVTSCLWAPSVHGACGLGLGSRRLGGWSLGRDQVEPKSEERSARLFLGFLFLPPRVLTTARQEPELVMGAAPGGWWGFLSAPSDCQLLVPEVEGSVQEQRAAT